MPVKHINLSRHNNGKREKKMNNCAFVRYCELGTRNIANDNRVSPAQMILCDV